jgi:hypothetical protein
MTPITPDHPSSAGERARRSSAKARLTPNRRRRSVENDEYASFTRRVIRAYARRVAAGDIDALATMTGLAGDLDEATSQAITGLRKTGYSWTEITVRLGVTRQAAQQRWGQRQSRFVNRGLGPRGTRGVSPGGAGPSRR